VLVSEALGIRMQDVTYRGDSAQLNDFVAGTLDVLVVGGSSAIGPHRNGQGRILAWTGDRRMPMTPDVPIFAEVAPEAVGQTWFGLAAPARTPAAAVERLSAAASRALQEPALRDRLLSEGQFAVGSSPAEYAPSSPGDGPLAPAPAAHGHQGGLRRRPSISVARARPRQ
jgi:tripartite-type tricarboxylate transporter receptor subunit TctC